MSQPAEPGIQAWKPHSAPPKIKPDHIHLWRVRLDGVGAQDDELSAVLSSEEKERAARFHFDPHRHRFIRTHGILRLILSGYTGIDAAGLAFGANPRGKPFLLSSPGVDLRFNLSHSSDLMVVGVTTSRELGVDVEMINENVEWRQIATHYFNRGEMQSINDLSSSGEQLRAFYRVWTIKEAYLKARGDGLVGGLDQVVVNLEPFSQNLILELPGGEDEKRRWQIFTFAPATGACGAVVTSSGYLPARLVLLDWKR